MIYADVGVIVQNQIEGIDLIGVFEKNVMVSQAYVIGNFSVGDGPEIILPTVVQNLIVHKFTAVKEIARIKDRIRFFPVQ